MTLDACAAIVEKGDPLRWSAVLAASPDARPILIPIYAANLEIARAPFAASEPMIAEMRVQWWVDALTEIAEGRPARAHEVTTPLAAVLPPEAARAMIEGAEARRRDCWNTAFEGPDAFSAYLDATGGALMAAAAIATGTADPAPHRDFGTATALASWLLARPELAARGRDLSRDIDRDALSALAARHLSALRPRPRGPAILPGHITRPVLSRAARDPSAIDEGRLAPSEFRRRAALLRMALLDARQGTSPPAAG